MSGVCLGFCFGGFVPVWVRVSQGVWVRVVYGFIYFIYFANQLMCTVMYCCLCPMPYALRTLVVRSSSKTSTST